MVMIVAGCEVQGLEMFKPSGCQFSGEAIQAVSAASSRDKCELCIVAGPSGHS